MESTEYQLGKCWLMVTGADGQSLNVKTEGLTLQLEQDTYDLYTSRGSLRSKVPITTKKFNISFDTYSDLIVTYNGEGVNTDENFSITNGSTDLKNYTVMQLLEEVNKKQKLAATKKAAQR